MSVEPPRQCVQGEEDPEAGDTEEVEERKPASASGDGGSRDGKRSAGVTAGDPRLLPGTRASVPCGVRWNRLTKRCHGSRRWQGPDIQRVALMSTRVQVCEEVGLREQEASEKKVVCELPPGGERQPCGRMSQAAGAGQSPWGQQ